jgi:hypothetical protein
MMVLFASVICILSFGCTTKFFVKPVGHLNLTDAILALVNGGGGKKRLKILCLIQYALICYASFTKLFEQFNKINFHGIS